MTNRHFYDSDALDSDRPSAPVRVKAQSMGDLIALTPYLTGYQIGEGLVVLVYEQGRIQLTASMPLKGFDDPAAVASRLGALGQQFPAADFIVLGFHSDRDVIAELLAVAEVALPPGQIIDVVYTDNQRYWSVLCQDSCCPPEGAAVDHHSPAALQAVIAGATAEPSREAIGQRVAGPSPAQQARDWLTVRTVTERLEIASCAERSDRLHLLLDRGERDASSLTHHELLELACLVQHIPTRDAAWLRLTRSSADRYLSVWLRVVEVTPDHLAPPALCLAGLAAWIGGHGTLLTVCVERGDALGADYSLLDILGDIQARAVPPSTWDAWREDLLQIT